MRGVVSEFARRKVSLGKTFLIRVADPRGLTFAIVAQCAAQCFIAGSAAAQLDGVVTRAGGSPLEGVSIEAWSVDRRIAATLTNALGVFTFSEEMVTGTVLLRVTALGFDVMEVEVRDGVTSYEIELTEEPLAVEGLVVAMENCPRQVVLAGSEADIQAAQQALSGKGGLCERLRWSRSYHTEAFRPAAESGG